MRACEAELAYDPDRVGVVELLLQRNKIFNAKKVILEFFSEKIELIRGTLIGYCIFYAQLGFYYLPPSLHDEPFSLKRGRLLAKYFLRLGAGAFVVLKVL